jgi:hypothetical protein
MAFERRVGSKDPDCAQRLRGTARGRRCGWRLSAKLPVRILTVRSGCNGQRRGVGGDGVSGTRFCGRRQATQRDLLERTCVSWLARPRGVGALEKILGTWRLTAPEAVDRKHADAQHAVFVGFTAQTSPRPRKRAAPAPAQTSPRPRKRARARDTGCGLVPPAGEARLLLVPSNRGAALCLPPRSARPFPRALPLYSTDDNPTG